MYKINFKTELRSRLRLKTYATILEEKRIAFKVTSTVASCGATRSYLFSICNYYYQLFFLH